MWTPGQLTSTAERSLRFIIRLSQASVDFTVLDDLFFTLLTTLEPEVLDRAVRNVIHDTNDGYSLVTVSS